MKLLLDTQLLLWAAGEPKRLPAAVRRRYEPIFLTYTNPNLVARPE